MKKLMNQEIKLDAFKEQMENNESNIKRLNLANQCRGRSLEANEKRLAVELFRIFESGIHDFNDVVVELNLSGVFAPRSGRRNWTMKLLQEELKQTNALLDNAYLSQGYGA